MTTPGGTPPDAQDHPDGDDPTAAVDVAQPADGGAAGDDERRSREHIAQTGEPVRDALGNADGAS